MLTRMLARLRRFAQTPVARQIAAVTAAGGTAVAAAWYMAPKPTAVVSVKCVDKQNLCVCSIYLGNAGRTGMTVDSVQWTESSQNVVLLLHLYRENSVYGTFLLGSTVVACLIRSACLQLT